MTGEQRDLLDVLAGSKAAAMLFDSLVHRLGDKPTDEDILVCRVLATRLTIGNLYQLPGTPLPRGWPATHRPGRAAPHSSQNLLSSGMSARQLGHSMRRSLARPAVFNFKV